MMNPNETPYALEIEDLCVEFRTRNRTVYAVNGLDLKIRKGETLGLVGETGAGKTTTGLAILNLIQSPPGIITRGSIAVDGQYVLKVAKPEEEEDAKAPEDGASGEAETAEESAPAEQPAAEAAQKPKKQKRMGWRKTGARFWKPP